MKIPVSSLTSSALRGIVENFVLREGTDYGDHGFTLDQKCAHVLRQLERGEAEIDFDPVTETVNIVLANSSRSTP